MTIKSQRPRLLSLSEVADQLGMKRPNVAKFLARRGVEPYAEKAQGYFWLADDITRVKDEREQDEARVAADRRRSESARRGRPAAEPSPPELARLGSTQRRLIGELLRRPIKPEVEADRYALRRLRERGIAAPLDGAPPGTFTITAEGRRLGAQL